MALGMMLGRKGVRSIETLTAVRAIFVLSGGEAVSSAIVEFYLGGFIALY